MGLATNIVRRAGSARYYIRIAVPKDLQSAFGRKEIWESLNTADPKKARELAAPRLAKWHRDFAERRRLRMPTAADLQEIVWKRYADLVSNDERFRRELPTDSDLNEIWRELVREFGNYDLEAWGIYRLIRDRFEQDRNERRQRLGMIKDELARGETRSVAEAAAETIAKNRFDVSQGSAQFRELAQHLQRAELEALQRAAERDRGLWGGSPTDSLVKPPAAGSPASVAPAGETIMELFERFHRERRGAISADTWDQNRKIVKRFAEFVGESAHISAVNRKNVRDWKDKLHQWPVKAVDTKAFDGKSFRKVIEANATLGKPTSKYPPAEPGALGCEPLEAASRGH